MCDLSKPSPAREHFIGLGNGLAPFFEEIESFTHINGRGHSIRHDEINFSADVLYLPLNHKKKSHRLLAFCVYNLLSPMYVFYKAITKKNRHNSVYSRHMPADIINILICKIFGFRFIVEINGDVVADRNMSNKSKFGTLILSVLQKFVVKKADLVVVPTANLRRNLNSQYDLADDKILHIENGVSLSEFDKVLGRNQFREDGVKIVGFAGTFSVWQGLDLIVDCCAYLEKSTLDNIKFVLVGDGSEFKRIKRRVEESGFGSQFIFTGMLSQSDYISAVKDFDICIAPYIKERNDEWGISPIKIHSYLACKKPIITSDISGAREIINSSGGGYLFAPDNAKDFARTIEKACSNPNLSDIGKNGYEYLKNNLTWDKLAAELHKAI